MKKKLDWEDLFEIMERDSGNRWTATSSIAIEYIEEGGYRAPSRAWPYSHAKALLTLKFAKWLLKNHPEEAKKILS